MRTAPPPARAASAGRLLREARERQGLHIAALAAAIKVTPKKLELLEADRFDALPDATFTRALAQTVCRALKIDSTPVLALLPPLGHRLDQVRGGLNAPFRARPGALVQRDGSTGTLSPVLWISVLFLIAAVGLYFAPSGWLSLAHWRSPSTTAAAAPRDAVAGVAEAASAAAPAPDEMQGTLPGETQATLASPPGAEPMASSAPAAARRRGAAVAQPALGANATPPRRRRHRAAASTSLARRVTSLRRRRPLAAPPRHVARAAVSTSLAPPVSTSLAPPASTSLAPPVSTSLTSLAPSALGADAAALPGAIQLRATAPSWIEVTDASGRALVARLVRAGETLDLEGAAPFRVRIGNASATRVSFRGQPMELAAYTRDNVARLELK